MGKLLKDDIENASPRFFVRGGFVNYGNEALPYSIQGVSHQFQFIENEYISEGRFLNLTDQETKAKVVVIGNKIKRDVFKDGESPVGKILDISGINFMVVGVYGDVGGEREEERIFMPVSTAQQVFNGADRINNMAYTLPPAENFDAAVAQSLRFKQEITAI